MIRHLLAAVLVLLTATIQGQVTPVGPVFGPFTPTFGGDGVDWGSFRRANAIAETMRSSANVYVPATQTMEDKIVSLLPLDDQFDENGKPLNASQLLENAIAHAHARYPEIDRQWYVRAWNVPYEKVMSQLKAARQKSRTTIGRVGREWDERVWALEADQLRFLRNDPVYIPAMDYRDFAVGRVGFVDEKFEKFIFDSAPDPETAIVRWKNGEFASPPIVISGIDATGSEGTLSVRGVFMVSGTKWHGKRAFQLKYIPEEEPVFAGVAEAARTEGPPPSSDPARQAAAAGKLRAMMMFHENGNFRLRDRCLKALLEDYSDTESGREAKQFKASIDRIESTKPQ